jgi:hypothetical protein
MNFTINTSILNDVPISPILTVTLNTTNTTGGVISDLPASIILPNRTVTYTANEDKLSITSASFNNFSTSTYEIKTYGNKILTATVDNQVLTLNPNVSPDSNEYYVNSSSTDTVVNGTLAHPFHNITDAVKTANTARKNITIYIIEGTYNDVNVTVTNNITVTNYQGGNVILDAKGEGGMFFVNSINAALTVINLNFTNGIGFYLKDGEYYHWEGGAIYSIGNVTVINSTFYNNSVFGTSTGYGGAIMMFGTDYPKLIINGSTFYNNTANAGGALYSTNAKFTIVNSIFSENRAYNGGVSYTIEGNITIYNSTFINNHAQNYTSSGNEPEGSVIFTYNANSNINISNSVLVNNTLISKNTNHGQVIFASGKWVADNNWWGNNTPFSGENNGSLIHKYIFKNNVDSGFECIPSNWIIMNLIKVDNAIIASLNQTNTSTGTISDYTDTLPTRTSTFTSTTGTFTSGTVNLDSTKKATTTYTPTVTGSAYSISATIDNQTLTLTPPATSLTATDVTVTYGEIISGTVTLTDANNNPLNGQSITYKVYNSTNTLISTTTITTDSSGQATWTNTSLIPVGTYTIEYNYVGNENNAPSNKTVTLTINKYTPTLTDLTINGVLNEELFDNITFNGKGVDLTGKTITYTIDNLETGTLIADVNTPGHYLLPSNVGTSLTLGSHSIVFTFTGDANYNAATLTTNFNVKTNPTFGDVIVNNISYGNVEVVNTTINDIKSGTVNVYLNNTLKGTSTITNDGKITYSFSGLNAGEYNVIFEYPGDTNYNKYNSAAASFNVTKTNPSFGIVVVDNIVYPNLEIVNTTINTDLKGKTVNVYINCTKQADTVTIGSNGEIQYTSSILNAGEYNIVFEYSGDTNYNSFNTTSVTFSITKETPSFSTLTVNNILFTNLESVNATITGNSITGNVNVYINDTVVGTANIESGNIQYNNNSLPVGDYNIKFEYPGDANHNSLNSTVSTFNVAPHASSITNPIGNNAAYGETLTVTSTISDGNGVNLSGKTVTVKINGTDVGTVTSGSNGLITYTNNTLNAGTYTITFTFEGDENYTSSSASNETVIVDTKSTQLTDKSVTSVTYPSDETISVNLTNGATGLSGETVTLNIDGTSYTTITNSEGVATFIIQGLSAGEHKYNFTFADTNNYKSSSMENSTFTINTHSTSFKDLNITDITLGESETVSVKLTDGTNGLNGKTVNIYLDKILQESLTTNSTGDVTYTSSNLLTIGDYNVTFEFLGDENYTKAENITGTFSVGKISAEFTNVSLSNITWTEAETVSATLKGVDRAVFNSVEVKIYVDGALNTTITTDDDGKFSYTINDLTTGNHNITFKYAGDDNYKATEYSENITVKTLNTIISGENIAMYYTDTKVLNITLKDAKGNLLSNKPVTVNFNGKDYDLITKDGIVNLTINGLSAGTYTVTYKYNGDENYTASNGINTITVTGAAKATTITNTNLTTIVNGTVIIYVVDGDTIVNTGTVNLFLDNKAIGTGYVHNGQAIINITGVKPGNYTVTAFYFNKDPFDSTSKNLPLTVLANNTTINTILTGENLTITYGTPCNYTGKLVDTNGNPVIGQHIALNLTRIDTGKSKVYWATTNLKGEFQLEIHLAPAKYTISASFPGSKNYTASNATINTVTVYKTDSIIEANMFNHTVNAGLNFTGKLYANNTLAPIIGQHIALNLTRLSSGASKVYWATTNLQGEFQLPINLAIGKYTITCSYNGNNLYYPSTDKATVFVNKI